VKIKKKNTKAPVGDHEDDETETDVKQVPLKAMPWALIIEMIMKIIMSLFNKQQAAEFRNSLTTAANGYGGTPDEDKATAARVLLQRAHSDTRRVRVFRRAMQRWAIDEVPPCCNMDKPKLSAAQLSEAKPLAKAFE
jgi:hypothetical protein